MPRVGSQRLSIMRRRTIFTGILTAAAGLVVSARLAVAQQPADIDAVKAANTTFYATLSARDAKAMAGLWANKPYVVNIGPRSKTIEAGYTNAVTQGPSGRIHWSFSDLAIRRIRSGSWRVR